MSCYSDEGAKQTADDFLKDDNQRKELPHPGKLKLIFSGMYLGHL